MKRQKPYLLNKTKYLSDREFREISELLDRFRETDIRNTLILDLALSTGARATELLNLRKQDVGFDEQSIYIHGIKGSNDRELPLRKYLFKQLERHLEGCRTDRIFPISYNRLRQIWQFYRTSEKSFHCLRHTFALRLYKKTKDLRLVQVALGHRNIQNTMIYAEYVYSQEELRKLIL